MRAGEHRRVAALIVWALVCVLDVCLWAWID